MRYKITNTLADVEISSGNLIKKLSTPFLLPLFFESYRDFLDFPAQRRGHFRNLDPNPDALRKPLADAAGDPSCDVFENVRRNIHLLADGLEYVEVVDRPLDPIAVGGFAELGFDPHADLKAVSHLPLQFVAAVKRLKLHVFQFDDGQ